MVKDNKIQYAASLALLLASAGVSANISESSSSLQIGGEDIQVSISETPAVDQFILLAGVATDITARHASHSSHSSHSSHASHASGGQ